MKIGIFCAALFALPAIAMAEVNPKNGNYYITFQDITQKSGDRQLNLTRTYNSKASENGWFGYGWGTPFETRMIVMPDSTVVVRENGTGQTNHYAPEGAGKLRAGVDTIVAIASQRDKLEPEAAEVLRGKLLADEQLRRTSVLKYGIQTQLPVGAKAQSSACAVVTRIGDEYRRTACGQGVDYFDLAGRLVRQESEGYRLTLHYTGEHPDRIEDSLGQKLFFKWTEAGHVAEARTEKPELIIKFSYDERQNLILSNEIGGNFYRYKYDGNHNMTQIGYIDATHTDMQYDTDGLIVSVANTDGSKAAYSYRRDPANPTQHYWATITLTDAAGETSRREIEYSSSTDAAGIEKLAGMTTTAGTKREDVTMDERGRARRVSRPDGSFSEYTYHPTLNKVSIVLTEKGRTDFDYNKAGDLIRARNSQGHLIELSYDSAKRIRQIVETNTANTTEANGRTRRRFTFTYNALNKPNKMTWIGKGSVDVTYDQQGEIDKVVSRQGATMALALTQAFGTLMEVVRVAGVNLSL